MNYYGETISKIVPAESIYQFLQKALKKTSELKPFRGPEKFIEGDFEYFNNSEEFSIDSKEARRFFTKSKKFIG